MQDSIDFSVKSTQDTAKAFKAVADGNRLLILHLLSGKPMHVCELSESVHLAFSTISRHLSILRQAGFVADERQGRWVCYRLNQDAAHPFVRALLASLKPWLNDLFVGQAEPGAPLGAPGQR